MLTRPSRFNISLSPIFHSLTSPKITFHSPLFTLHFWKIYVLGCKRPSFTTRKLVFYHPKACLLHPQTYTFRKTKVTPSACRNAEWRVKRLITSILQIPRPNRLSSSLRATIPPATFRAILDVKIVILQPSNFNTFPWTCNIFVSLSLCFKKNNMSLCLCFKKKRFLFWFIYDFYYLCPWLRRSRYGLGGSINIDGHALSLHNRLLQPTCT